MNNAINEVKFEILENLFSALSEANQSDCTIERSGYENDLDAKLSSQESLFGHIAEAIKSLGFEDEYNEYCETGEIPEQLLKNKY